jgi:predicted  nucleic acid-binding Zn-ribbon protein
MSSETDIKKFDSLKKECESLKSRKDKLEGQLKASQDALAKLEAELKAEGINSKEQLEADIQKLETELATTFKVTEAELKDAALLLDQIEFSLV